MSKKKSRKSRTSKGIHGTTSSCGKAQGMQRLLNQLNAHLKGKRTRVTLPTDKTNTALMKFDGSYLFDRFKKPEKQK